MSVAGGCRKKLPPTPVATSLEGLEIGIPPGGVQFTNPWLSKPLPKIPDRTSSIYSRESIINSYLDRSNSNDRMHTKYKTNRLSPHTCSHNNKSRRFRRKQENSTAIRNSMSRMSDQANRCSLTLRTFLSEEQYGVGMHLAKANHYFREKKWEIFPELGPQPVAHSPPSKNRNLKRKRILGSSHPRNTSNSDGFGLNLRPIADYMQQTLVNKTSRLRLKKKPSNTDMAVSSRSRNHSPSSNESSEFLSMAEDIDNSDTQLSIAAVRRRMRELALWSRADSSEETLRYDYNNEFVSPVTATSSSWRSPASGFNASSSTTLNSHSPADDRFMNYYDDMSPSAKSTPKSKLPHHEKVHPPLPSPPSLPEYAKALQKKTNHVLLVLDGAKKKFTEARAARRRKQLKKHIRVIGPIENYPYGSAWV